MYKIISEDKIIDLVKNPKFIRFLPSGHVTLTDMSSAQGIMGSDDTIYSFSPIKGKSYLVVTINKITTEVEFKRLQNLLNSNQIVSADESALATAKRIKLSSLSSQCKTIIIAGFYIKLSDGKTYGFKLTTEDQLNLMLLENKLISGEDYFIYHATNQPCQVYNREDMTAIVAAFRKHVLYHTTYFNAAKQYLNDLTNIEKVNLFRYGDNITEFIKDPVIKQILKNGGVAGEG